MTRTLESKGLAKRKKKDGGIPPPKLSKHCVTKAGRQTAILK